MKNKTRQINTSVSIIAVSRVISDKVLPKNVRHNLPGAKCVIDYSSSTMKGINCNPYWSRVKGTGCVFEYFGVWREGAFSLNAFMVVILHCRMTGPTLNKVHWIVIQKTLRIGWVNALGPSSSITIFDFLNSWLPSIVSIACVYWGENLNIIAILDRELL